MTAPNANKSIDGPGSILTSLVAVCFCIIQDFNLTQHNPSLSLSLNFDISPLSSLCSAFSGGPGSGVVTTKNNRLVMAGWYNWLDSQKNDGADDTGANLLYSDDNGDTWNVGAKLPKSELGWPNESQVALLRNGSLIMNSRNAAGGDCHCRILSRSDDSGETFAETWLAEELIDPVCQGSTIASTFSEKDLLVFSNAHSTSARVNGTIMTSSNGGQNWELNAIIDGGNFVYSALAELKSDTEKVRMGVVWETDKPLSIRFKVAEL